MRKRQWRVWILGLLFFMTILLIPTITDIKNARVMAVEMQQIKTHTVEQAKAFYLAEDYQQAAELWQKAVNEFAANNQPLNQAMALSNLSLSYQKLGQWQQAEAAILESVNRLKTNVDLNISHQVRLLAQVLNIQGNFYLETGDTEKALETWREATELYTQINEEQGIVQSQINQAQALQILGFYPKACQTLFQALTLNYNTCEWSAELSAEISAKSVNLFNLLALRQLGELFRLLGDFSGSMEILSTALEQAQALNSIEEVVIIYLDLGQTQQAQSNHQFEDRETADQNSKVALSYYQKAADLAPQPLLKFQAQIAALNLLSQTENWQGFNQLLSALNIDNLPINQSAIYTQIYLTEILLNLLSNKIISQNNSEIFSTLDLIKIEEKVKEILTEIDAISKPINSRFGIAYSYGLRGKFHQIKQDWNSAENLTIQALNTIENYQNKPIIAYQFLWQLGQIRKALGKPEQAIANYTQAVNLINSLRQDIIATNLENRFNFQENIEPVYRELIDLHLQKGELSDLKRAIDLFESLQIKELNNFFQFACLEEDSTQIDRADPNGAVLYTIILPHRLEVIAALPGQPLRHYSTTVSAAEVKQINLDIRRNIGKLFREKDILPQTQKLYQWLIQPIRAELDSRQMTTLIFTLDGSLRNIPMAFIHDGKQYLVENYNIALALPGLKVRHPNPIDFNSLKLLVGGLSEARQNFPPLPAVEAEVKKISQQFTAAKILLNDQFTTANLQKQIRQQDASIIHLATHGQFSSNREQTFILTANDQININNFEDLLKTRQEYGTNPIELLVLSACQTASGDNRATLGLAGVAVRSGARSTLATLWSVNDESTAQFMETFYQKLTQPNVSRAEALRLAQIEMIKSGNRRPFLWAPFILVGNWF
jgi:CHAT domain-containing protein